MSLVDIGALSIVEIIGDFSLKEFANNGGTEYLITGIGGYIGVIYMLIRALQGSDILTVNNAWDAMSSIIESLAAFIFLGERPKSIRQFLGIVFIILGLLLMDLPTFRKTPFKWPNSNHKNQ